MMKRSATIDGSTTIVRNDGLLSTEVDGELLAMSVERGSCYGLNGVGTRIWALIEKPRSIDSLCAQLVSEYEVDEAQCRREVIDLIAELRDERLVTLDAG
jgi:hypothetical protein